MKILVSVKSANPKHGDFNFTRKGEPVVFGGVCDNGPTCGCARSMTGINTRKGTTTFTVADRKLTGDEYLKRVKQSEERAYHMKITDTTAKRMGWALLKLANEFPVGAILELTHQGIRERERTKKIDIPKLAKDAKKGKGTRRFKTLTGARRHLWSI